MKGRNRVLIISSAFPPSLGSGTRRLAAFVGHLREFGWEPYVLTRTPSRYYAPRPAGGLPDIPGAAQVVRTRWFDLVFACRTFFVRGAGRSVSATGKDAVPWEPKGPTWRGVLRALAHTFVFVPDTDIGWYPYAIKPGLSTIRRARIGAIVSSAPPLTPHLVALRLKRLTSIPWVADFSDPWTQHPDRWFSGLQGIRKPLDRLLEKKVMRVADIVVADSEPRASGFAELGVQGLRPKLRVVTNAFDPLTLVGRTRHRPAKFTITYTGTFVSKAWSPAPFFAALAQLIRDGPVRKDRVAVRIIESYWQGTDQLAARHGLSDVVTARVAVPHTQAVQEQIDASVLLFMMRNDPGGLGIYTGKLFEYLGARRPILALGQQRGVAAELIREASAGTVVDSRIGRDIKDAILKYYLEHERTGDVAYRGREEVIRRYESRAVARQLAEILDSLTHARLDGPGLVPAKQAVALWGERGEPQD